MDFEDKKLIRLKIWFSNWTC